MNILITEDAASIANLNLPWNFLKDKTILITGANGYVPQYFVHGFLKRNDLFKTGIKVIAMCRNQEHAANRFAEYEGREDFELYIGDVRNKVEYNSKVDFVIHAASPAGQKSRYEDPIATFDTNVFGSKNMLEFALQKQAEFLFLSSIDVYGKQNAANRLKEDSYGNLDPLDTRNIYSCAKRAAETLCNAYIQKGLICKIARPSQILGGGIQLDDGRLHADFVRQLKIGNKITLKGDGTPLRTFMYITDAISAMLTIMLKGKNGEAYNVMAEEGEATVLQLVETFISCIQSRKIAIEYDMVARHIDPAVTNVISVVCGSSEKLRNLGWEPSVTLSTACMRLLKFYDVVL